MLFVCDKLEVHTTDAGNHSSKNLFQTFWGSAENSMKLISNVFLSNVYIGVLTFFFLLLQY